MDATDADLDDEQVDGQANGDHMPGQLDPPPILPTQGTTSGVTPGTIASAKRAAQADVSRARSPTPPRALFRSTTGKGVAFTDEDVTFLVRFLEYRNRTLEGKVDMVLFWKEVAMKVRDGCLLAIWSGDLTNIPSGSSSFSGVLDEILQKT